MTTTAASIPPAASAAGAPAVSARGLSKFYGEGDAQVRALDDVSVSFEQGEFTAIMGASGSGKSTLLHCVAGLDEPTSGQVWIGATDITALNDQDLTILRRENVGFVFQSFNLIPTATAQENILLPLKLAKRKPDQAWFEQVTRILGLSDRLTHKPSELSGGQQQRVAVARALITRPQVIFADEPTGALDSHSSTELLDFMRRSVDELGQTIVMVTHSAEAAGYADRVLTLADGKIISDERPSVARRGMTAPTLDDAAAPRGEI